MSEPWPIEDIPDPHILFMRVHKNEIQSGAPIPGAFRNRGEGDQEGMSTDWSQYSTAEQTKQRTKNASWEGGVIEMVTGDVRKIPHQTVIHAPLPDNRSHTNVKGLKDTRIRYLFMRTWRWAVKNQA